MKKFTSFILVLLAVVIVGGFLYWNSQAGWSKDTLKIEILGPEKIQAGEEMEYLIKFKNNGKVRLENLEFIFQAPERSIIEGYPDTRVSMDLEDIYPGQEETKSFKTRLFGAQGDILSAEASLSYQPKNLKARYESKTSLTTQVDAVPLSLEFDLPLKVEQGEDTRFSLNYFSNIDYLLESLRMRIEYPDGFEFLDSKPDALDETEWDIFSLGRADGGRIEINGIINGEENEQKVFKAQLGILKNGEFWLLKETKQTVEISEPSFYISQLINNSLNYIAKAGEMLHYEVFFKNIGRKPIQKKFLFLKLEGEMFDLLSLKSTTGEFGAGDNSIIWDWKNVPDLRFLDAGEEGMVDFWVKVKEKDESRKIRNPILANRITLGGTEKVLETMVSAALELSQKVFFEEEFFGNTGPLPPQVGVKTTYTVLWQVRNSWNALENVKVKSVLPIGVKLTGEIFPENAKFTYDSGSREVIWNIGEVDIFQGWDESAPLTIAFQIEFAPSSSQKGKTPILFGRAEVSGEDTFTEQSVQGNAEEVNAALPDDDTVSESQGIVQ